eukprot:jgi/Psemu1/183047/e_gw1.29.196.1
METEETNDNDNGEDNDEPPPLVEGTEEELKGDTKDDDDDDDEDDDKDGDDSSTASDESKTKSKEDPELALAKALVLKEEGNKYFIQEKDFDKASRSYRKGVNRLKKLNKANSGDEQVKALLLTLQTNLSMMLFKLGKHRQSRDVASKALEIDPDNVKARYRRAVAHRKLGDSEDAVADLKSALETDPVNAPVRKELASIQKEIQRSKKAQRESLRKAFSKGGLLNDDRVEDEKAKAERLAREEKEKEEALKKRKQKWEDDCVSRMAKGEEAIGYEDWDKEQIEKEKAAEEEATRKRKEDEKRRKEERKKAKAAKKATDADEDSDDDAFTEKELAAMRGYKKTADGRITSYFSREQSAEEKAMLDIAPKPISDSTPQPITPSSVAGEGAAKGSSWNHAGTWEEKDTTEWCKNRLEKRLLETKVEAPGSDGDHLCCSVSKVKDVTGDASVAVVSGKKRYIFDLHCKVVFEIKEDSTGDVIAEGSLSLPDICSTHHDELEVTGGGWKKSPSKENQQVANDCRLRIVSEIRESVKLWVKDFNNHY